MLRAYERVLSVRPLSTGNREFSRSLLAASRQLGLAVEQSGPLEDGLATMCRLVARQSLADPRRDAGQIVQLADAWLAERWRMPSPVTFSGRLPRLRHCPASLTVVFGPGLGLGDEVGFFNLVRRLGNGAAPGSLEILTQYPGTWPELLPVAREISYRGDGLRLLHGLREMRWRRGPHLLVLADFEYKAWQSLLGPMGAVDVLEISLARATAWYTLARSGCTFEQNLTDAPLRNHYWYLHGIAERLRGDRDTPWAALAHPRTPTADATIIVNPLSSKPVLLSPHVWADMLAAARQRLPSTNVRVVVYPGLDGESARLAREVAGAIGGAMPRVDVRLLHASGTLEPKAMGRLLSHALSQADLCLTLDTYTAHLAPVLGTPTVVLAYADNPEFWVPSPWAFYCLPHELTREAPRLIAWILDGTGVSHQGAALQIATDAALARPTDVHAIASLFAALSALLAKPGHDLPFREQGAAWVSALSRLLRVLEHKVAEEEHLLPHLLRWQDCAFMKAVGLETQRAARRRGA